MHLMVYGSSSTVSGTTRGASFAEIDIDVRGATIGAVVGAICVETDGDLSVII